MKITRRRQVEHTLRGMREHLAQPYGWVKHQSVMKRRMHGREYVGYCLTGANSHLSPNRVTHDQVLAVLKEVIYEGTTRPGSSSVIAFNDAKATKKNDVLRVLDTAIARVSK